MRLVMLLLALGLGPASAAAQENFGRLFLLPQQRQELDRRRQANIQEAAAAVTESLVTVNGQVSRSSGKSTTWINGVPQESARKPQDPARATLSGAEGKPSVSLKIGQTLDRVRGEVRDPVGGRILTPSERREPRP
jgi:hypothetical protein